MIREMIEREVAESIARHFNFLEYIKYKENGEVDFDNYDWKAGCNCNGIWLCPKTVYDIAIEVLEEYAYDYADD